MGRTGRRGLGLALVAVGLIAYLLVGTWRGDRDRAGSEPGAIVAPRDAAPRSSEAVGASPPRDEVSGSRFVSPSVRAGAIWIEFRRLPERLPLAEVQVLRESAVIGTSGRDGRFVIPEAASSVAGTYVAIHAECVPKTFVVGETEPGVVVVDLAPGAFVEGRVVDESGQPVAGAVVEVTTSRQCRAALEAPSVAACVVVPGATGAERIALRKATSSNDEGKFIVRGLPAVDGGGMWVRGSKPGFVPAGAASAVPVPPAGTEVVVTLHRLFVAAIAVPWAGSRSESELVAGISFAPPDSLRTVPPLHDPVIAALRRRLRAASPELRFPILSFAEAKAGARIDALPLTTMARLEPFGASEPLKVELRYWPMEDFSPEKLVMLSSWPSYGPKATVIVTADLEVVLKAPSGTRAGDTWMAESRESGRHVFVVPPGDYTIEPRRDAFLGRAAGSERVTALPGVETTVAYDSSRVPGAVVLEIESEDGRPTTDFVVQLVGSGGRKLIQGHREGHDPHYPAAYGRYAVVLLDSAGEVVDQQSFEITATHRVVVAKLRYR